MEEQEQQEQQERARPTPRSLSKEQIMLTGGALLTSGLADVAMHFDKTGVFLGLLATFIVARHSNDILDHLVPGRDAARVVDMTARVVNAAAPQTSTYDDQAVGAKLKRLFGLSKMQQAPALPKDAPDESQEQDTEPEAPLPHDETVASPLDSDAFVQAAAQRDVPGIPRLTIAQIVQHLERNSYEVYIGRSMTRPGHPAVRINFYKRHMNLIGASQHGKSSMAAALLECILRTHDRSHVLIALLDHEDKTSQLFANAPHIAKVRIGEQVVRLHARSYEQVLEHLEYLSALIDYRYTLSEEELDGQPLVIVYLEEFIDLKDYFKHRVDAVEKDEKEQAKRDYARLVFCIKKIARRGLKVLVQLLMCAQVDYRDEDLQEALVNVTSGMSFCVRVSAAQAAGFYQTELLQRNAREDKVGQTVVEMPDCKGLILAPEYDLKAHLKALAQVQKQAEVQQQAATLLRTPAGESGKPLTPAPLASRAAKITVLPARIEHRPQPTLQDAIMCWNELVAAEQNPSRNNLQQALIAKGFDCKENWARKFYEDIKDMLANDQPNASVGG